MADKDEVQKALDAANLAAWLENQEAARAQQDRLRYELDKQLAELKRKEAEEQARTK